jgi:hypothetical protein
MKQTDMKPVRKATKSSKKAFSITNLRLPHSIKQFDKFRLQKPDPSIELEMESRLIEVMILKMYPIQFAFIVNLTQRKLSLHRLTILILKPTPV